MTKEAKKWAGKKEKKKGLQRRSVERRKGSNPRRTMKKTKMKGEQDKKRNLKPNKSNRLKKGATKAQQKTQKEEKRKKQGEYRQ